MSKARDERRFRIYDIDPDQIIPMLNVRINDKKLIRLPSIPAIPEGADLIEIVDDSNRYGIGIVVAHPSFEPVRLGDTIPRCGVVVEWETHQIQILS